MHTEHTARTRRRIRTIGLACALLALGGAGFVFVGCVHRSGGAWMIDSAPRPQGWPELSPVGEVVLRTYPAVRSAEVDATGDGASRRGDQTGSMFRVLFNHINENDIAMTAPVDMGLAPDADAGAGRGMQRMAFLYRSTDLGSTGADGKVVVADHPQEMFASTGVRGAYSRKNYEHGLDIVTRWLTSQSEWRAAGEPRYLGYNGPFTLWFLRYGEVQVPVRRAEFPAAQAPAPTPADVPPDR